MLWDGEGQGASVVALGGLRALLYFQLQMLFVV